MLAAGNVRNIDKVDDQMAVTSSGGGEADFHTLEKGDARSKFAKQVYDDANQYNKSFDANKPTLKEPRQDVSESGFAHSRMSSRRGSLP